MSEEYRADRSYTAFWPMLIILISFLLLTVYQLYGTLEQRSLLNDQYTKAQVNLPKADDARARLASLVNDLISVSTKEKNNNATQVLREAAQAGIIKQAQGTNSAPAAATP